jgi:hypothetical protein
VLDNRDGYYIRVNAAVNVCTNYLVADVLHRLSHWIGASAAGQCSGRIPDISEST